MTHTFRARPDVVRIVVFPRTLWFDGKKCHMNVRTIPRDWPTASPYSRIAAVRERAPDRWQALDGDGEHLLDLTESGAQGVPLLGEAQVWEFGRATFEMLRRFIDPLADLYILNVRLNVSRPEVIVQVVA